jgi:hypothetical protein
MRAVALPPFNAHGSCGSSDDHPIPASPGHQLGEHDDRVATPPGLYAIRIRGRLGATALSAFPSMAAELKGSETVLTGRLEDQSALFGVLTQIEALGLDLVELRQVNAR